MRLGDIEYPDNQLVYEYLIFTSQIRGAAPPLSTPLLKCQILMEINYSLLDAEADIVYLEAKLKHFIDGLGFHDSNQDIEDFVFSHNLRMRQMHEINNLLEICDLAKEINPDKSKNSTENRISFYLKRAYNSIYSEGGKYDNYDDLYLDSDFI